MIKLVEIDYSPDEEISKVLVGTEFFSKSFETSKTSETVQTLWNCRRENETELSKICRKNL